jgi:hypothetical protein
MAAGSRSATHQRGNYLELEIATHRTSTFGMWTVVGYLLSIL